MRKNKLYSLLLSLAVSFCLWLYVVNNVSKQVERPFTAQVTLEGQNVLKERNLTITDEGSEEMKLIVRGSRSDLNKLDSEKIFVKADVSKITEPGTRIRVNYVLSYPGDTNIQVISRKPEELYIDVDHYREKELDVRIKWTGTRSEDYLYDTGNAVLTANNAKIDKVKVSGPASVVDQIDHAEIVVDLSKRVESISETYRYTLVDANGTPVKVDQVTTNIDDIRVEVPIQRLREVHLAVGLTFGGGATDENTTVTITPELIRVSGGEAVLAELGEVLTIANVNLAELEKNGNTMTYPIVLPEGVINQTGVSEATVTVTFQGLSVKEFTLSDIRTVNVPAGLSADVITSELCVKLRGPVGQMFMLDPDSVFLEVDLSNAEIGTETYKARVVLPEESHGIGALNSYNVSVRVHESTP